ncbi:protoporphyrinogen oxidase [Vulgatibacter incomptus]|uniref:Protoporphyrinogen IX oxidase, aerobic, HemY n=1 Tax=Vulgatibacter incomptus TaxID=1391653 RepID=A0A0K1PA27_9BACT|nr:protoporphyrinogen oxidase [Vulgatibacter incomptus]AKU90266.1 Protoporphyrinogen IX oxidase, aerobic, HemY [Vulgatibacter incomptus]
MRVAIVGGGISGLALAERLAAAGAEPLVLEADDRAGGKIATRRKDGFLLEAGPNGFLDKEPATLELASRIGLRDSLRQAETAAKRRWVFVRGALREVPSTPPAFLRSDILPPFAKARVALEPFSRRAKPGVDESIADFGRRHLGARATRDLLGAMVLGIFGGDVEKLSLASCFPKMAELERAHRSLVLGMIRLQREKKGAGGPAGPGGVLTSVEGGLGHYPARLAETLGSAVRTGVRVDALSVTESGVRLHTNSGGRAAELDADAVAITAPADVASRLLAPLDPALGELAAGVPYAPMAVVHLAWPRARIAHPLDGFGFLVPPHEGRGILGAIFVSSIFPWRAPPDQALFTVMIGGAVRPELAARPEAELATLAASELGGIIGASGDPSLAEVIRWQRAIPQYVIGHEARRREAMERIARLGPVHLGGNAWRGIGVNDCIAAAAPLATEILDR